MSLPNIPLAACNPELWFGYPNYADSRRVDKLVDATWVAMDCPGCLGTERAHRMRLRVSMKAGDTNGWLASGTDVGDLTFNDDPSVSRRTRSVKVLGHPCHCHFNITRGAIDHYGDSSSP